MNEIEKARILNGKDRERTIERIELLEEINAEKDKEIERLNQYIEFYKDLDEKQNKELQNLRQKVKYYENFEINKTVDKIRLENNKREKELIDQLQQKENILKEVREYIEKNYDNYEEFIYGKEFKEKVLEILDKENKNENN